jgi:TatD DNase family protein
MLIDTHCHLDFPEYDFDRDEVILRAKEKGVEYIINIGSSLQGSRRALDLSEKYDCVYATLGIHPHEADTFELKLLQELELWAKKEKIVAIGEIGLDYFSRPPILCQSGSPLLSHSLAEKNYSKQENQRPLFVALIKLAKSLNLPLVIHSRQAEKQTLEILKEAMPIKAVVHCFSGPLEFLNECLSLGLFISFTCNITYKKADNLRQLVKLTPLEKLLLETDAPFLPPEGYRGKRNEPWFVHILAEEIARIKEIEVEEVAKVTTDNAKKFFNLR